jgi:hypothetical protein
MNAFYFTHLLFACFLSGHFVFDSILTRGTYEQAAFFGRFSCLGGAPQEHSLRWKSKRAKTDIGNRTLLMDQLI